MRSGLFIALIAAGVTGHVAAAQQAPAPRAEILVLGTYHMANPGRDIFNTQADDVLAAKRQKEIADVVEVLKKFRPTRIALEGSFSDDRVARNYADYLAGKYQLTRNERDQLGFRLAKELGHKAVHPVDVGGEFPYLPLVNYAKANGREQELNALMDEVGARVKALEAYLSSHTILETLLYMNDDAQTADAVGAYFQQAQFGGPWDWAGADLVSAWFKRNMRIYTNIVRLVDSPGERVLVIYGAGHLGWLQFAIRNSPNLRLRTLAEIAR
jgi:hypothetical protein